MKGIETTGTAGGATRGVALRRTLELSVIASLYFVAAQVGFTLAFVAEQVTVVWAPTGIALAALLLLGYRVWPAIYLGAFFANLTAHEHVFTAAAIALGNTLEAVIATLALRSFVHFDNSLGRVKDVVGLAVTAMACSVVSATIGATSLCVAGHQTWARYGETWFVWWLGDAMGALVAAPPLLTWYGLRRPFGRVREAGALVVLVVGINALVFGPPFISSGVYTELQYTVFPIVIWAALRFGPPGSALVTLVSSTVSIWGTAHGYGPFASRTTHQSLILLQLFMCAVAGTGMLLAAIITERDKAERGRSVLHAISRALGDARDTAEASRRILQSICHGLDWNVGALWLADEADQELRCIEVCRVSSPAAEDFEHETRLRRFSRGVGLPGRVWVSCAPAWIADVVRDSNFRRSSAAARAGLHGAFAVPISSGERCLGVIEFLSREVREPDNDLLQLMAALGSQVGVFVERLRAEEGREQVLAREHDARREAEAARIHAQTANRVKDEFLATVSHELRTPLNAVLGWSQLLRGGKLEGDNRSRAIETIHRSARAQAQLIDDLLDVSSIITGKFKLSIRPVELRSVIEAAIDSVRPAAQAKGIEIAAALDASLARLDADPNRLQQVVWNLLSNAIKFTPPAGKVEIHLRRFDSTIELTVSDTGQGMAPEFLPHVFERFWQADSSNKRAHGGLGLGLAIVRHIVELHGGTVEASSSGLETGAVFTIRLPARFIEAAAEVPPRPPAESSTALRGIRVLVVDTDPEAAEILSLSLRTEGADCRTALGMDAALAEVRGFRPQVLVADVAMPNQEGYELVRALRALERDQGGGIPAIAHTAYRRADDPTRSLAAGYEVHLARMPDPRELIQAISRLALGAHTAEAGSV
jgi:signal transduction histidine kinase/integral membrane sensor domain MASE1/ActR/RegA family two-component response regulator